MGKFRFFDRILAIATTVDHGKGIPDGEFSCLPLYHTTPPPPFTEHGIFLYCNSQCDLAYFQYIVGHCKIGPLNQLYFCQDSKEMSKMDPSEVEFLSEKQLVKILPNFKEGRIFLISVGIHL